MQFVGTIVSPRYGQLCV